MNEIFGKEFSSGPFELFSTSHLIALGCLVALILFFTISRRRFTDANRQNIRYAMAIVLVLNEIAWHVWNAAVGQWNIQTMLPFHLCSVFVWIGAYMLVKKDARIYEFAYLLGIPGALQATLTPDLGIYDFPHFRYYQVFISHGLIIVSAIYMTVVEGFRPTPRSLVRVLIGANIYMVAITALNFAIGSNYLFTAHKPPTASLLDLLPAWPWYLPIIELLGWFFVALMYLPFAIRDGRKKPVADSSAPL